MRLVVRRAVTPIAALTFVCWSERAVAQGGQVAQPAPLPSAAPAQPACVPACRYGYFCHQGQCVSICNPPCPPDQVCVDGARCEFAYAGAGAMPPAYEPPPPPKKPFADRTHTLLAFHLGFGGDVEQNDVSADLDTTLGFNLRVDIPVARYLLLGPLFQLGFWRPDSPGPTPSRSIYFDIDLFVRGRYPIELESISLQVWAGVPIGLSLSFLGEETGQALDGFGIGWNVGILFGGAIHFTKKFGMFAEAGWLQHKMSHELEVGSGDVDFRIAQGNFNIGFVFGN